MQNVPKSEGEAVNPDFNFFFHVTSEDKSSLFHERRENKQQLVRGLFESVKMEEHDNKCLCF